MVTLTMTKGLPGSGKSTWAKKWATERSNTKRVNKDDLRKMLDNGKWSKNNEKFVLAVRDEIIVMALDEYKQNVIVDDTNLAPKHEARLRELAKLHNAEFQIKDFTDVPIETCIKQDLMRLDSVGEAVIRKQYKQFLAPKVDPPERSANKQDAVLCDLDGTLALFGDANPYDRDFLKDQVNEPVRAVLDRFADVSGPRIILVSGRDGAFRPMTNVWLQNNSIYYNHLFMRAAGDKRKDFIIKEEIYRQYIEPYYNVLFVLDDRNQVVDLWRRLGLTCFQVADGEF